MEYEVNIGREYEVNIARDLANAPKGLRLWSPLFGQCRLDELVIPAQGGYNVKVSTVRDNGDVIQHIFGNDGRYFDGYTRGECMLFPDECVRWNEWQYSCFRRSIGSVITSIDERSVNHTFLITSQDSCIRSKNPTFNFELEYKCKGYRYATPAETEDFFRELAQAGYEWDTNAMKLVKLPSKEKADFEKIMERRGTCNTMLSRDVVSDCGNGGVGNDESSKGIDVSNRKYGNSVYTKVLHPKYEVGNYIVAEHCGEILVGPEMITEVLADKYVLGDDIYPILLVDSDSDFRLAKDWEIAEVTGNKGEGFGIPPFKPFLKVLVRDTDGDPWDIAIFKYYNNREKNHYKYACMDDDWAQCIPYNEETEKLLRTTDKPDEKYVTWR